MSTADGQPVAIILVGLPGCGKSTWVKAFTQIEREYTVLSTDNIIEELGAHYCGDYYGKTIFYHDVFQQFFKEANALYQEQMTYALNHRQDIIIDRTNLVANSRIKLIKRFKAKGYKVVIAEMVTQVDVWMSQLANRKGKYIKGSVIGGMVESYEKPDLLLEEFDQYIRIVSEK